LGHISSLLIDCIHPFLHYIVILLLLKFTKNLIEKDCLHWNMYCNIFLACPLHPRSGLQNNITVSWMDIHKTRLKRASSSYPKHLIRFTIMNTYKARIGPPEIPQLVSFITPLKIHKTSCCDILHHFYMSVGYKKMSLL